MGEISASRFGLGGTRGLAILISLTLPHFALTLVGHAPGLMAPWLQEGLDLTRAELGLLNSARFISSSVMFLSSGFLVQRWGPAVSMLVGLGVFGLGTLGLSGISALSQALLLFFVSGLGFAMIHPATTVGIIREFQPERRATIMGIKETGVPIGGAVSAIMVPYLAIHYSWRWAFVFCGVTVLICALLSWWLFRTRAQGNPVPAPPAYSLRSVLALMGRRDVLATGLMQAILMAAQFATLSYLLLYLVESVRLHTAVAVGVVAVTQVGSWCARLAWGLVSDHLFGGRQRPVMAIICLTIAVSLVLLAAATSATPPILFYLLGFLLGAGAQGWVGVLLLMRSDLVGADLKSVVTAAGYSIGAWGGILGPPLFGYVVDVTHSYRAAWLGVALSLVLAVGLLRLLPEPDSGRREPA